jgi:peptide/nickel transport system permease protein
VRAVAAFGSLAGTLLVATFLVYVVTLTVPGDPAIVLFHARYGDQAAPRPDLVDAIRHEAGFDQPLVVQYANWLGHVLRGDLGVSLTHRTPILPALLNGLPITLGLVFGALLLALLLSLGVGVLASQRQWLCSATLAFTQLGLSLPEYFFALVLMLFLAVQVRLLPVSGWGTPAGLVLPVATLMLRPWATFTRLVVTGVDEARGADFVRTGRAKGLGDRYLLYRHVLPHALLPVINLVGISASGALATALIVEVIFAIPGVGRLLYQGVLDRDIPLVQACLLVQVSLAVTANMASNVAMRWVNPAMRR